MVRFKLHEEQCIGLTDSGAAVYLDERAVKTVDYMHAIRGAFGFALELRWSDQENVQAVRST